MPLSTLIEGHRAILRMHHEIIDAAGRQPIGDALPRARRALGSAVSEYLVQRQSLVIAPLRDSRDPVHQALARRCIEDDLTARQEAMAHYRVWTMRAVEENPREFRMVVRQMARKLERRIEQEEATVFPAVLRLQTRSSEAA